MTTALYRISSGEVRRISLTNNLFTGMADNFEVVISDPTLTNGSETKDPSNNLRVLGYSKILDGTTIRNATQQEIDTFAAFQVEDGKQREANAAIDYFKTHPHFRRIMTAFSAILIQEINILRSEHGLAVRTLSQFKTAIEGRINKND